MQYFRPVLSLPADLDADFSPVERLGGQPWGLGEERWPLCSECGQRQSLLAQFLHAPPRLDLGADGRMLFVFMCNHDPGGCATWEGGSGTNACFVLEPHELIGAPSDSPPVAVRPDNRAVVISAWQSCDDGIEPEVATSLLTGGGYHDVSETVFDSISDGTRLGSVPFWVQSEDEAPKDGWRFVGQLDGSYSFLAPPRSQEPWVFRDEERYEGRTHRAKGANFGGGGLGYVFLKDGPGCPQGWFFWQR